MAYLAGRWVLCSWNQVPRWQILPFNGWRVIKQGITGLTNIRIIRWMETRKNLHQPINLWVLSGEMWAREARLVSTIVIVYDIHTKHHLRKQPLVVRAWKHTCVNSAQHGTARITAVPCQQLGLCWSPFPYSKRLFQVHWSRENQWGKITKYIRLRRVQSGEKKSSFPNLRSSLPDKWQWQGLKLKGKGHNALFI